MPKTPDWLPNLIVLDDYNGEWPLYLEALYQSFREDFITSSPTYPGKRWSLKRHPLIEGKEATFWHIISEGQVETERLPDLRRCERIRWPRPIIERSARIAGEGVNIWRTRRRQEERVVIAVDDFSYVVVLADRGSYIMLWTAYCVEQKHRRQKLRKEYENYRRNGLAPSQ